MTEETITINTGKCLADKLAQNYRILAKTICNIAEIYLYEARLDDAFQLLDSGMLVEEELIPEDRARMQTQRAKMMIYQL